MRRRQGLTVGLRPVGDVGGLISVTTQVGYLRKICLIGVGARIPIVCSWGRPVSTISVGPLGVGGRATVWSASL